MSVQWQDFIKLSDWCYEIPQSYRDDMRVPARIFMTKEMFEDISEDRSLEQLVNVSTLPGIAKAAFAMPDIHQGYGFPIGGVAETIAVPIPFLGRKACDKATLVILLFFLQLIIKMVLKKSKPSIVMAPPIALKAHIIAIKWNYM